jgi:hypothetical protein
MKCTGWRDNDSLTPGTSVAGAGRGRQEDVAALLRHVVVEVLRDVAAVGAWGDNSRSARDRR